MTARRRKGILSIFAVVLALGASITAPSASAAPAQTTAAAWACPYFTSSDGRTFNAMCDEETPYAYFRAVVTHCGVSSCKTSRSVWWVTDGGWRQFTPGGWITIFHGFDYCNVNCVN